LQNGFILSENLEIDDTIKQLAQYKEIIDKTHIVSKTDAEGRITYANDRFAELTGFSEEELLGKSYAMMRSANTPATLFDEMWGTLRRKKPWSATVENLHKNGTAYQVSIEIFPIVDAADDIIEYIGIYHEIPDSLSKQRISEEIEKRQEVEQHLKYLQNIIDQQNNIVVVSDGEKLVMVNHQFLEFFSMPSLQAFKDEFFDISHTFVRHDNFFHPGKVAAGSQWIKTLQAIEDEKSVVSMVDLRTSEPRAFAVKVGHLEDSTQYYILTFTDITNLTIQANQYFYEATHDKLTGIINRSHFSEVLAQMIETSRQEDKALSLLMIGIDNFKVLNEQYGSQKGDEIIKNTAETISMHLRMNDQFARWGGVEFALLMPDADLQKAEKTADNIRTAISSIQVGIDEEVTVSISVLQLDKSLDSRAFIAQAYEELSVIRNQKNS